MNKALEKARELLAERTPLKADCGKVCGARCCRSMEGEETGMLLFPGEEALYREQDGWTLRETPAGWLAICSGRCRRDERPLACRIFPLLPVIRNGQIRVASDQRAKAVCPLLRQGIQGMNPDFTDAVREAGRMLAEEPESREFLVRMTEEQDEIKALRDKLGGL